MGESWYDVGQVCLNGHIINDATNKYPIRNQKYCDKCGEKTITACENCVHKIRGDLHVSGVYGPSTMKTAPNYCENCGQSFPWTKEKLNAARELAELLDGLTEEEQEQLKASLDDLVKDGPRTVVATTRFKRIVSKTGPEIALGFKDILIDVVSETVKKALWG